MRIPPEYIYHRILLRCFGKLFSPYPNLFHFARMKGRAEEERARAEGNRKEWPRRIRALERREMTTLPRSWGPMYDSWLTRLDRNVAIKLNKKWAYGGMNWHFLWYIF